MPPHTGTMHRLCGFPTRVKASRRAARGKGEERRRQRRRGIRTMTMLLASRLLCMRKISLYPATAALRLPLFLAATAAVRIGSQATTMASTSSAVAEESNSHITSPTSFLQHLSQLHVKLYLSMPLSTFVFPTRRLFAIESEKGRKSEREKGKGEGEGRQRQQEHTRVNERVYLSALGCVCELPHFSLQWCALECTH